MRREALILLILSSVGCLDSAESSDDAGVAHLCAADNGVIDGSCTFNTSEQFDRFLAAHVTRITGFLKFTGAFDESAISLPDLQSVSRLAIEENTSVASLNAPALQQADLDFVNDAALSSLVFPRLTNGTVKVRDAPLLNGISIDALVSADSFEISGTKVARLDIDALANVATTLDVEQNSTLSAMSLSSLSLVGGSITIDENPSLPQCIVDAIINKLEDAGGLPAQVDVEGNRAGCSCVATEPQCQ